MNTLLQTSFLPARITAVRLDGQIVANPEEMWDAPSRISYDAETLPVAGEVVAVENVQPKGARPFESVAIRPDKVGNPCFLIQDGDDWDIWCREGGHSKDCPPPAATQGGAA